MNGKKEPAWPRMVLIILAAEKVIQHLFVTYAFFTDLGGIRATVNPDILMVSGFFIGLLFLLAIPLLIRRKRSGYRLLLFLALFDFVGEFIAQGTAYILITVSFLVASVILLILIFSRKSWA